MSGFWEKSSADTIPMQHPTISFAISFADFPGWTVNGFVYLYNNGYVYAGILLQISVRQVIVVETVAARRTNQRAKSMLFFSIVTERRIFLGGNEEHWFPPRNNFQ